MTEPEGGDTGSWRSLGPGRSAPLVPSPTIMYVNICRTVMNADPKDPNALDELQDFMPYLRQSITCLVCSHLIQNPMRPSHDNCQHIVCRKCLGGRMRLKPKCTWCRDQSGFIKDRQLKALVNCYVIMCSYVNNVLQEPLQQLCERKPVSPFVPLSAIAPLTRLTASMSISDMVKEGVDFERGEDDSDDEEEERTKFDPFGPCPTPMKGIGEEILKAELNGSLSTELPDDPDLTKIEIDDLKSEPIDPGQEVDPVDINAEEDVDKDVDEDAEDPEEAAEPETLASLNNLRSSPSRATTITATAAVAVKADPERDVKASKYLSPDSDDASSTEVFHDAVESVDALDDVSVVKADLLQDDVPSDRDHFDIAQHGVCDFEEAIEDGTFEVEVKTEDEPLFSAISSSSSISSSLPNLTQPMSSSLSMTSCLTEPPNVIPASFVASSLASFPVAVSLSPQSTLARTFNLQQMPVSSTPVVPTIGVLPSHTLKRNLPTVAELTSVTSPKKTVKKIHLISSFPDVTVTHGPTLRSPPSTVRTPNVSAATLHGVALPRPSSSDPGPSTSDDKKPKRLVARIGVTSVLQKQRANYVPVPSHPSLPHSTQVRRFVAAAKQRPRPKPRETKKAGCRCGMATQTPGQLTCCGQRCPCYVGGEQCVDCRCRGCRNPYDEHGNKRELSLQDILRSATASVSPPPPTAEVEKPIVLKKPGVTSLGQPSFMTGRPVTFSAADAAKQGKNRSFTNRGVKLSPGQTVVTVTTIPSFQAQSYR